MNVSTEKLKKDPLPYMLTIFMTVIAALFFMLMNGKGNELKAKDSVIADKDRQLDKLERKKDAVDSVNHSLYELLGAKRIVDSLRSR